MKNIYNETIKKVSMGAHFNVDFQQRNLKINGNYIIKGGKYDGSLGIPETMSVLDEINNLYHTYRHSVPTERSESKQKCYFRALPETELSDEDMMYAEQRDIAQVKLELFVLGVILNKSLKWNDFAENKWFWQSQENHSLILLKEWFEPNNE